MEQTEFRAWDKEKEQMFYPEQTQKQLTFFYFYPKEFGDESWELIRCFHNQQIESWVTKSSRGVLMQSTGLKDKNGEKIYKGDIVKHDYAEGEGFKSGGLMIVGDETPDGYKIIGLEMFDPKSSTTFSFDANKTKQDDVVVIGNIYENPELIEKES